jgi:hypothetical protein
VGGDRVIIACRAGKRKPRPLNISTPVHNNFLGVCPEKAKHTGMNLTVQYSATTEKFITVCLNFHYFARIQGFKYGSQVGIPEVTR